MAIAVASLLLAGLTTPARAEGDAKRGEAKFGECAACHTLKQGENNVGPSLHGIFGRKAGELTDFRYSPALKKSGIVWSAETLDSYIADPQAMVPANRMPYAGLADKGARADLIAYLKEATK
ncbi:MAG TPA: c-type cytochrome [Pseudolabrys sp.]|nr:c-type cytochrome [Pseudolabrys sp.]